MRVIPWLLMSAFTISAFGQSPAPGKHVEQELQVEGQGQPLRYLLYLPPDYEKSESKLPLMLFLHGRGESDGPLSVVKKWGPPRLIERGESIKYIVASPQCPRSPESWTTPVQQKALVALLEHLQKTYRVDEDRIFLTGLSMGGYGSWRLAADHPGKFAAVVPICGGGNTNDAGKLRNLPIWAWHGMEDRAVPPQRSLEMVEAIRNAGGTKIRYTTLEHIGHNSWEAAYASPELSTWLDEQRASKNRE